MMANWIAIASANHVNVGREGGFMQVCHGKSRPLARTSPGDTVIYYSPACEMRGKDRLQSFTAAGTIIDRDIYQFDMGGGFVPWRRDVDWLGTRVTPIHPLLDALEFTRGKSNWGFQFRFGLFSISGHDRDIILNAMVAYKHMHKYDNAT